MAEFALGKTAELAFSITEDDMATFASLSGDRSAVHWDAAYARKTGFEGVIVYGGLLLAKLSHLLGNHIPGNFGVSLSWSIQYHKPLYVGEPAQIALEIKDFSPGTRLLSAKFKIVAGERLVASGNTQSLIPADHG